jgi:hypothetical protein
MSLLNTYMYVMLVGLRTCESLMFLLNTYMYVTFIFLSVFRDKLILKRSSHIEHRFI